MVAVFWRQRRSQEVLLFGSNYRFGLVYGNDVHKEPMADDLYLRRIWSHELHQSKHWLHILDGSYA